MSFEYRVRWQREEHQVKHRIYQRRQSAARWALILQARMAEATGLDPDDDWCCRTAGCACEGRTNAEHWAQRFEAIHPLVAPPTIERRDVGPWKAVSA